jgi:hypothetical protein
MPAIPFIIVGTIFGGIIIYRFFFSNKAIVKRRLRKATPRSMSEIMNGEIVRISGNVELPGKILTAPLSGRKCSYYHVHVERKRSSGKSHHWVDLVNEEAFGDVVIREGNQYAIISTANVKSYVLQDRHYSSGFLNDAAGHLKYFLEQKGIDTLNWLGLNKTLRYKEGILEQGETVTVAGRARWIRKSETTLNIPSEKILLIEPAEEGVVYFTDDFS